MPFAGESMSGHCPAVSGVCCKGEGACDKGKAIWNVKEVGVLYRMLHPTWPLIFRLVVLKKALESENSLLLYPGRNGAFTIKCIFGSQIALYSTAVNVTQLPQLPVGEDDNAALFVLDGTWAQAKSIFAQNPILHSIRQVSKTRSGNTQ